MADAVGAPVRAGREDDDPRVARGDRRRVDRGRGRDLDAETASAARRQSTSRRHSRARAAGGERRVAADLLGGVDEMARRRAPRRASTIAHSMPADAGADDQHAALRVAQRRRSAPGCQPRRYSSPVVAFCVHAMWSATRARMMQTLQPMHSRMSSRRPSAILRGRNGSAIAGRAAPIRSSVPAAPPRPSAPGSVRRPTPTIGFAVRSAPRRPPRAGSPAARAVRAACRATARRSRWC